MLKFKFYYFGHIQISENVSGIYAIVNTLNNKKYIGSSENLRKRYRQHFNNLNKNKHANTHLQRAYNKYGASVFEFWILEECDNIRDTLITLEQKWIDSDGDYNICKLASHHCGEVYTGHVITETHRNIIPGWARWSASCRLPAAESCSEDFYGNQTGIAPLRSAGADARADARTRLRGRAA